MFFHMFLLTSYDKTYVCTAWFALCYQTVVCLSVTLLYCGQTVGWIQMKLGTQVGPGSRHIVLDGDPAPPPPKRHNPQFSADICCGQIAGWINMPLGREVGVGPGHTVLGGAQLSPPQKKGHSRPIFGPCLL